MRFCLLFLIAAQAQYQDHGLAACKAWMRTHDPVPVSDYLVAEGFARGFPNRQQDYATLIRHSNAWHDLGRGRLAQARHDKLLSRCSAPDAPYPLSLPAAEVVVGHGRKYRLRPLCNGRELIAEGMMMSHCVGDYATLPLEGRHVFLHVDGPAHEDQQAEQATLWVDMEDVRLIQLYGPGNAPVSDALRQAVDRYLREQRQIAIGS